jgi:hypothetical protein
MQTKGKKSLKKVIMTPLAYILKEKIEARGGKAAVCRALGFEGQDVIKRESVKLGQYETGRQRPKPEFLNLWKEVFQEDLLQMEKERNVSRGTESKQKHTSVPEPAIKRKEPESDEVRLLIKNLDRVGATNEYLLNRVKELEDLLRGGAQVI